MSTLTASEARSKLYRLIDETATSHQPILITGKRANAVLVSEEDWEGNTGNGISTLHPRNARVYQRRCKYTT